MTQQQTNPAAGPYDANAGQFAGPILVATKGTADWSPELEAARLLVERDGGRVKVVVVLEPVPVYAAAYAIEPPPIVIDEQRGAELREFVREQVRRAVGPTDAWSVEVVYGAPAYTIPELARESQARLLVMGIGRHTPLDRVFGDETSLRALRHVGCPVLAVTPDFVRLPRRAVVGVDFSPSSVWAAEEALRLLDDGGSLTLMHVRSRLELSQPVWAAWDVRYNRRVTELFERLTRMLPARPGVRIETVTRTGDAVDEILGYAHANSAELVAVGSHGAGLVERILVGSVATAVIRRSTRSVLACPRPMPADAERIERALTGTITSVDPARWAATLDDFTRRNAGRPASLEVDDPTLGAQGQQSGFAFLGASYDHHDRRVEIMLGDPASRTHHLTRNIAHVGAIAIGCEPGGRDRALSVTHGRGQTLLTFRG